MNYGAPSARNVFDAVLFVVAAIPTPAPVTQAPVPTDVAATDTSSGLSQDAVAGIVIGVIGGLLLVVLIAMYIYDRRTDISHAAPPSAAAAADPTSSAAADITVSAAGVLEIAPAATTSSEA